MNKTGNSWKTLHSIISKLCRGKPEENNLREVSRFINSYGIQEDELWLAEKLIERIQTDGWRISFYLSDGYPSEWMPYGEKSPPLIFHKGNLSKKITFWTAIVGTTHPDSITSNLVKETVKILDKFGVGIITGGAPGIDSISTESALLQGMPVRIVLPTGALNYTPTNIVMESAEQGLCHIVSPWTPNSKWCKSQAVRRNQLIAYSASLGFIFNPSHEGGSFRVAKNLFSRNLPVFVYKPEMYAWYLRYSKLVYPISTDDQTLNIETIERVISSLRNTSTAGPDTPYLELF